MWKRLWLAPLLILFAMSLPALAGADLDITLKSNSADEAHTREQLLRLVNQYDLAKYLFTRKIIIDQEAIPHSHPVLTLHTRHLGHDDALLSTFVHEEFHWLLDAHSADTDGAVRELRSLYPKVPAGFPEGANNEESTYQHLIVCYLEYQAMKALVGKYRAKTVMGYWAGDHYTWIYKTMLSDEARIGAIVARFHLSLA